jgi:hypothetical protein
MKLTSMVAPCDFYLAMPQDWHFPEDTRRGLKSQQPSRGNQKRKKPQVLAAIFSSWFGYPFIYDPFLIGAYR